MLRSTLEVLAPPWAPGEFELIEFEGDRERVDQGWLLCRRSQTAVPICAGFPLFAESMIYSSGLDRGALRQLERRWFGDPSEYELFVRRKWRQPAVDIYAAFQPFNESTQALFPLVDLIRSDLEPGQLILDLWCRTGWSGELLAALFPQQRILALWEGNTDTLGYRGFRAFLGARQRAANLELLFHHPDQPLPFRSGTFALVHGLDSLHRYHQPLLLSECLRVARAGAPLVFPHVHLTNSEPDPWFDRGELQLHGRVYADHFGRRLPRGRKAFVLSEKRLFQADAATRLGDDPDMAHYNALIFIGALEQDGAPLAPSRHTTPANPAAYVIVNPLLKIDLHRRTIAIDDQDREGRVRTLLDRHPIYRQRLAARLPEQLNEPQCELLYWAGRILPVGQIADRMAIGLDAVAELLTGLEAGEIVQVRPISAAMAGLQHYLATQEWVPPAEQQTLPRLWRWACERFADRPLLLADEDQSVFRYGDADRVIGAIAAKLEAEGITPGARIALWAEPHVEAVFGFWAAMLLGTVFVPIDASWPAARVAALLDRLRPSRLLVDRPRWPTLEPRHRRLAIVLDAGESSADIDGDPPWLAHWIDDAPAGPPAVPVEARDPAVILFTSGSTGAPKGVELSHGALFRSARRIAELYGWRERDVLLSLGELHAISGLRNPLIATVQAGASFVLPAPEARRHPLGAVELIERHQVTVLATVPALLQRLAGLRSRLAAQQLASLRQVLSTAAALHPQVRRQFGELCAASIYDYYGLTESCGACVMVDPSDGERSAGAIGRPFDVIARVLRPDGGLAEVDEAGELALYGENLMLGYFEDPARAAEILRGGWLFTGDLVRRRKDGLLELVGRRREIVKSIHGDLLVPAEIEAVLAAQPGVVAVAVCGLTAADGNEELVAFVELEPTLTDRESLWERLRGAVLAALGPHHLPARFVPVDTMPRGTNAKILKPALLEKYPLA